LRREVDRTLELAPDFSDALAGKGALLLNLPRLLGGDAAEGERLLRRALEIDADYLTPRLALVDALRARGARDEARMEAARALAIAERKGSDESARAAREALAALGRDSGPP
jgi:Tfp pilus assembly protein PilF